MARPVSVSTICKYAKSRLGYGSKQFYSPYQLGCMALEIDGLPQPSGVTYQKWCYKNIEHISSEAAKYPVAEKPRAVKRVKKTYVATDAFLNTFQWRKLRMEALKKYGPKCMCCGATPATGAVMNVDHIKPRKLWPSLAMDIKNLQILCHECNHGKGNWDQTDWRS
jgi:5-methylcytosine-specific restriction endonuclease McrA